MSQSIPLPLGYEITEFDIYRKPTIQKSDRFVPVSETNLKKPIPHYIPPSLQKSLKDEEKKKYQGSFPDRPASEHPDFQQAIGSKMWKENDRKLKTEKKK